jgi:transposase
MGQFLQQTGKVQGKTAKRHTSEEFVAFLDQVVASAPAAPEIHIVLDNLSAHKTRTVAEFLERNPRVRFHFTPTYSSWLNQVEIWFAKIQRDVIARGIFTSVADLSRKTHEIHPRGRIGALAVCTAYLAGAVGWYLTTSMRAAPQDQSAQGLRAPSA